MKTFAQTAGRRAAPRRVVVTGLGVVAPNGVGVDAFAQALRRGRSGIRRVEALAELGFSCQVAGVPPLAEDTVRAAFREAELRAMNRNHIYAGLAALEAWRSADLPEPREDHVHWDTGAVIGTGIGGMETIATRLVDTVRAGRVRRLGSTLVEQVMASGVSARVGGLLGLGGPVTTNSSACTTGTEAVVQAFRIIRDGHVQRMLAGGSEEDSFYIWAGFDAMRVLSRRWNHEPERASRPLSASAGGFVPAAGAAVLVLENLDSAIDRGAPILAEVLGAHTNSGGQRLGGSMTAPNPAAIVRCIREALEDAGIGAEEVDLINGHLTGTGADPGEIAAWQQALERPPERFPMVTATKSLIGHALGAAGALELAATVLMLRDGFVHPCLNCEDLHPALGAIDHAVPRRAEVRTLSVAAKAGFGFGDVNACVILRRWPDGSSRYAPPSGAMPPPKGGEQ